MTEYIHGCWADASDRVCEDGTKGCSRVHPPRHIRMRAIDASNFDPGDRVLVRMLWGNTRWQRLVTWAAGGLLGFGSPTIATVRKGGRPTFREAWSGVVTYEMLWE